MTDYIEQLALEKDFAALSPAEKATVLAEMPQEDYNQLRKVLRVSRRLDDAAMPPVHLREKLLSHMTVQTRPSVFTRLLTARIPAWQTAAIFLLGIAAVTWMKKEIVIERRVTEVKVRVDTVFQEKTLWRDRIVVQNKVVYKEKKPENPVAYVSEKIENQPVTLDFQATELLNIPVGTSLGDTPELMDFFTQGGN